MKVRIIPLGFTGTGVPGPIQWSVKPAIGKIYEADTRITMMPKIETAVPA